MSRVLCYCLFWIYYFGWESRITYIIISMDLSQWNTLYMPTRDSVLDGTCLAHIYGRRASFAVSPNIYVCVIRVRTHVSAAEAAAVLTRSTRTTSRRQTPNQLRKEISMPRDLQECLLVVCGGRILAGIPRLVNMNWCGLCILVSWWRLRKWCIYFRYSAADMRSSTLSWLRQEERALVEWALISGWKRHGAAHAFPASSWRGTTECIIYNCDARAPSKRAGPTIGKWPRVVLRPE